MASVGSQAVRELIERYQPLVAFHGHIHESPAMTKIGRTVCINPGSECGEGVLHGALVVLEGKRGCATISSSQADRSASYSEACPASSTLRRST